MPAPRQIGSPTTLVKDQQFDNLLRAAQDFFAIKSDIVQVTRKKNNPMMEDSFEKARKAFFGNKKP